MSTESILSAIESIGIRSVVQEAVLRALIATHPDPAAVRKTAESLLAQVQSTSALSGSHTPHFRERSQQVLDGLFQPPISLPPD